MRLNAQHFALQISHEPMEMRDERLLPITVLFNLIVSRITYDTSRCAYL